MYLYSRNIAKAMWVMAVFYEIDRCKRDGYKRQIAVFFRWLITMIDVQAKRNQYDSGKKENECPFVASLVIFVTEIFLLQIL